MPSVSIGPELLAECLANKRAAQRALYDRSLPVLSVLARRYLRDEGEIKDVLQDSYIQLFQKLSQYDAAKASFSTWSGRIVINNCLKRNAKQKRLATDELCPESHAPVIAPEVLARLNEEELRSWLKRMPADFHAVFLLHVVDGFSHQEVAELLKIPTALSRQRLSRARKWLAKELVASPGNEGKALPLPRRLIAAPLLLTIYAFIQQLP